MVAQFGLRKEMQSSKLYKVLSGSALGEWNFFFISDKLKCAQLKPEMPNGF